jgi:hypothetical protein
MKKRNWFWGTFLILAAVCVIGGSMNLFANFGTLSIISIVVLLAVIVQSCIIKNFFGVFIGVAGAYYIYQSVLGLPKISIWVLIVAVILLSCGFHMIFGSRPSKDMWYTKAYGETENWHRNDDENNKQGFGSVNVEDMSDNHPYAKVNFGASCKYLHGTRIKSGEFYCHFGALEVFFDQAQLDSNGAEIFLDCSFGAIKLYIPATWQVYDSLNTSLGGVENNTKFSKVSVDAPKLTLKGNVNLGGVEIKYV